MKYNIVFSCISLDNMAGGLERNLVSIANLLVNRNYKVSIITFDNINAKPFFKIDERINWHKVNIGEPHKKVNLISKVNIILSLRKFLIKICNFDKLKNNLIICFHHGILLRYLLAKSFLPYKIICSERNSLSFYKFVKQSRYNVNFLCLFFVNKIIVQFKDYIADYPNIIQNKIIAIPNQIKKFNFKKKINNKNEKIILNIGRLEKQKRQLELIKAFKKSLIKHNNLKLLIIGNGSYLKKLINEIEKNNLHHSVKIIKEKKNLENIFINVDIFCLTSEWEGFPNVLAESLLIGLPSIGPKSCSGANLLIKDVVNGILFDDSEQNFVNSLSSSINFLIEHPNKCKEFSQKAKLDMESYNSDNIIFEWEKMIVKCFFEK